MSHRHRRSPSPEILSETLVPFSAAHTLPGSPSISQLDRWTSNGSLCRVTGQQIFLEFCYMPPKQTLYTSVEAVRRFHRKWNGAA